MMLQAVKQEGNARAAKPTLISTKQSGTADGIDFALLSALKPHALLTAISFPLGSHALPVCGVYRTISSWMECFLKMDFVEEQREL